MLTERKQALIIRSHSLSHVPSRCPSLRQGAGSARHMLEAFTIGEADAALAASIFHYKETSIKEVKDYMKKHGVNVR